MNTGPIAHRYAKALLNLVQENLTGDKVYAQVCLLVSRMQDIPQLADALQKRMDLPLKQKIDLLEAALGDRLADELLRFVDLVNKNRRMEYLSRILVSFLDQYRAQNSIKVGRLVSAREVPQLKDTLEKFMQEKTGAKVLLEESIDESLIGGFVLQVDDLRMDASVAAQLQLLHRELIDDRNRIV